MPKVADWAYGRPEPQALLNAGYSGVIRYLSRYPAKNLTSTEFNTYWTNGLDVHVVFQDGAHDARRGYDRGAENARYAVKLLAQIIDNDARRPIYFAVDYDARNELYPVLDYFRGIVSVLPAEYVGIYGSAFVVDFVRSQLGLGYAWQTKAWSDGRILPYVNLYQNGLQQTVGVVVDINNILSDDTGAITMGYADDQLRQIVNTVPGLNPSEFATVIPLTVTLLRELVNGQSVIRLSLANLQNSSPGIDYNELARAIVRELFTPTPKAPENGD